MERVAVPLEHLMRVIGLADSFGEPSFTVIVGEGDGRENGIEDGRVAILDAELSWVADYKPQDVKHAERLRDLLNAVTGDLGDLFTPEQRRKVLRDVAPGTFSEVIELVGIDGVEAAPDARPQFLVQSQGHRACSHSEVIAARVAR